MIGFLARIITRDTLGRVFDLIDKRTDSETERQALRAEVLREHLRTRGDYMRAGGFVLMLLFAVPLAAWFGAVVVYSILWCAGCAYPQAWSIAALPQPLDEWAGAIIVSIFGVVGISRLRR